MRRRMKRIFVLFLTLSMLSALPGIAVMAEEPATDISEDVTQTEEGAQTTEGTAPNIDNGTSLDSEVPEATEEGAAESEVGPDEGGNGKEIAKPEEAEPEKTPKTDDTEKNQEQPAEDAIVTFSMDASIFDDINSNNWYHPYVSWVLSKGIMTGIGNNKFAPVSLLSRAQFATVLYRMSGSPDVSYSGNFPDVPDGVFYSKAVSWASQNDVQVVTGYENGNFGPVNSITREEMATMLHRYAKYKNFEEVESGDLDKFPDASSVSEFASDAMKWAVGAGIISGDGGRLNPQGSTNRAVCATMIQRFCEKFMPGQFPDIDMNAGCDGVATDVVDKDMGTFWIRITGVWASMEISKVEAQVWCSDNRNDTKWYKADLQGDGTYGVLADPANHKYNTGTYKIEAYVSLTNGIRLHIGNTTAQVSVSGVQARVNGLRNNIYNQVGRDLYACFMWSANMDYYAQGDDVPGGYTPSQWFSIYGMENGRGDCQVMAATFYQLAKGLGYDAHYLQGYVPLMAGGMGDHGWVEINMNGTTYVFDPDFQHETGRNGYQITYGASGTWRYTDGVFVD